ncbi:MAG: hypothetical protein IT384_29080 [Deltaproteobacteria bacterium]|nr:hypothetical protein [Deltaproteobacteria bacterium]
MIAAVLTASHEARAQLWNPLDTKPKPNMLVAFDTSVTMAIKSDCSGCHRQGAAPPYRLDEAKEDIRAVMPLFEDLFAYGGYLYRGCGVAHVVPGSRCYPDPNNLEASFDCVDNMIASAGFCGSSENRLPGTAQSCITPFCAQDAAILGRVLTTPRLISGLTPPPPPAFATATCDRATSPVSTIDVPALLAAASPRISWPQWEGTVFADDAQQFLCEPLLGAVGAVWRRVEECLVDPYAFWPGITGWLGSASSCNPEAVAATVCTATTSPFVGTCVCGDQSEGCTIGQAQSACGVALRFKARQQIGICESYNPETFQAHFRAQPDNRVNTGGCRENVALYFTDGFYGNNRMIRSEVSRADHDHAFTPLGQEDLRNRFVFRVADAGNRDHANTLQLQVSNHTSTAAYSATNRGAMTESFAVVVNRVFRGVYSGASATFDRYSQRVAFHLFTVPAGAGSTGERYLGRPSRIAWHAVDPDTGAIDPAPIFETDWASVAGPPRVGVLGGTDTTYLGPGGRFRNGVPRIQEVAASTIDRTGDGVPDAHPRLRWGHMLGGASTQPVIVEAPREIPSGPTAGVFASFMNQPAVRNRPRVIYVLSNGYLHAFHAGVRRESPPVTAGEVALAFDYIENAESGRELWRYKPPYTGWLDTTRVGDRATYVYNDVTQQPILNGQIVVREMKVANANSAADFQTLLAFSQGKNGRGYAVLDVTDPMRLPVVRRIWVLPDPSDRASQEPMLYALPAGDSGRVKTSVIVTGGLGGTRTIYRYDVIGSEAESAELPGDGAESYPTEPICFDVTGRGYVTHCYVLSSVGRLARVEIAPDGSFGTTSDITPAAPQSPIGGGRVFHTRPVVFFGGDGAVNLVFGSGDATDLTHNTGSQEYVFKVKDERFTRAIPPATGTSAQVCGPDPSGNRDGSIALAPGERLVSPPIVAKGVVAFTTFTPGAAAACGSGSARLYAFNYERCTDAFDSTQRRPSPVSLGGGIPTSPVLLRASERIAVMTSAEPAAARISRPVQTSGGRLMRLRRLFWRPHVNTH